jgi:hypothetical protein
MVESNGQISQYVRDKAHRARLSIESYYAQSALQCAERDARAKKLEMQMAEKGKHILTQYLLHLIFRFERIRKGRTPENSR